MRQVALAQLDGRILLDSPHLVERKKVASPDKGEGAGDDGMPEGGMSAGPGSPHKVATMQQSALARGGEQGALLARGGLGFRV